MAIGIFPEGYGRAGDATAPQVGSKRPSGARDLALTEGELAQPAHARLNGIG